MLKGKAYILQEIENYKIIVQEYKDGYIIYGRKNGEIVPGHYRIINKTGKIR